MGIESPVHLLFLGAVALIVLGPKRLPEMARALGHGLREFRGAMSGETPPEPRVPTAPSGASSPTAAPEAPGTTHSVDSAPSGSRSSTGQAP